MPQARIASRAVLRHLQSNARSGPSCPLFASRVKPHCCLFALPPASLASPLMAQEQLEEEHRAVRPSRSSCNRWRSPPAPTPLQTADPTLRRRTGRPRRERGYSRQPRLHGNAIHLDVLYLAADPGSAGSQRVGHRAERSVGACGTGLRQHAGAIRRSGLSAVFRRHLVQRALRLAAASVRSGRVHRARRSLPWRQRLSERCCAGWNRPWRRHQPSA